MRKKLKNCGEFKKAIKEHLSVIDVDKNNLLFSQTLHNYSVAYKPKYPEDSPADFIIVYNHINDSCELLGNSQSVFGATRKKGSFEEILELLDKANTKTVRFSVACMAVYQGSLEVPANLTQKEVVEYIQDNLPVVPVKDLEWLEDLSDQEAVTADDVHNLQDFKEEE